MKNDALNLDGVQETLLLPLWGRAVETKKQHPLLRDGEAVRIVDHLEYDFAHFEKKVNPITRNSWIARSIYFDEKIRDYLHRCPDGTVINVGCGLDTTYERINNGKATWYELDFPEVIETRRALVKEDALRIFLGYSVLDEKWYAEIGKKDDVLILMAGVIYYFEEPQVRELFRKFETAFGRCTILLDYSSSRGVEIANKKVIEEGGMDQTAHLKWGIDDISSLEKWSDRIKIIHNMKMFHEHRRKYPLPKRIGMWMSDTLSIMSLSQIVIE